MELQLFKLLEVVVKRYTRVPTKDLMDHYLRIKAIVNVPPQSILTFLSKTDITHASTTLFLKRTKEQKSFYFVLVIDHELLFNLSEKILSQLDQCVIINKEMGQCNNILPQTSKMNKQSLETRAIIFKTAKQDYDSLIEQLDAYLSICELFHGHIHLIANCFQADPFITFEDYLKPVVGDQFEGINEDGYFRILEERASKVTLDELSQSGEVQKHPWGEAIIFQDGYDGIVVWITEKYLPSLQTIPVFTLPANRLKQFPVFLQSKIGLKIFKNKQLFKDKLQTLNLSVIIFNISQDPKTCLPELSACFGQFCKKFFSNLVISKEMILLGNGIQNGQRLSALLGISSCHMLKQLLKF